MVQKGRKFHWGHFPLLLIVQSGVEEAMVSSAIQQSLLECSTEDKYVCDSLLLTHIIL